MTCPASCEHDVEADMWVDDFAKQQYGGGLHLSPQDLSRDMMYASSLHVSKEEFPGDVVFAGSFFHHNWMMDWNWKQFAAEELAFLR